MQISWNVDCMDKIIDMSKDLWYNHELIAERFCNETLIPSNVNTTVPYIRRILDCTQLGYDSAITNTKMNECTLTAFGGITDPLEKRSVNHTTLASIR